MDWLSFAAGALVIIVTLVDVIWTSMWVAGGAGPITRAVGNGAWHTFKLLGRASHRLMLIAGPFILTLTVLVWLLLLWAGWFLLFSSEASAVLTTSTNELPDTSDRIYFVGYTLFTLGNGDFAPNGDRWQLATALAAGSGLFTATLAITYLLSVISAAVSARAFATEVDGLGDAPAEVVAAGWDGHNYSSLAFPLQSLSSQLTKLSQQYLAYPVFQYFHAGDASKSPIVALAKLDQILAVSAYGVPSDRRAPAVLHNSVRSAIQNVLESLPQKFVEPAEQPIPVPDLETLSGSGLPVVATNEFQSQLSADESRRKQLAGLLRAHGWSDKDLFSAEA